MRILCLLLVFGCTTEFDRTRIPVGFGGLTGGAASRPGGFEVCEVTSLAESGPGSLRACLVEGREIVFAVSGDIVLTDELEVPSFVTIRGETAGEGITLRRSDINGVLNLEFVQDVIIRGLRAVGRGRDSTGGQIALCESRRVLLDHLVLRDARTGVSIAGASTDVTVSNTLFSEMNNGINAHNFPGSCVSTRHRRITIARNLFHRVNERAPRFAGGSTEIQIVNNIAYGWHWFEAGNGIFTLEDLGGEFPSEVDFVGNAILAAPGASNEGDRAVQVASGIVPSSLFASNNQLPAGETDLMGLNESPRTDVDFDAALSGVLDGVGHHAMQDDERAWVQTVRGAL